MIDVQDFVAHYVIAMLAHNDVMVKIDNRIERITYEDAVTEAFKRFDEKEAYENKYHHKYF